ncbi:tetratricopeptide repeat protein [Alphaproteobacteria bacterium LSUCC0684]
MNDFIHEINQELREERRRALWKQYGKYVIAMAVAVVVLVAGRQGYVGYQENARQQAADSFHAALADGGMAELEKLAGAGEGYPMLARFHLAGKLAATADPAAEEAYLEIARDSSLALVYRDAAMILSVMNAAPSTDSATRKARLEPMVQGSGTWRLLAAELLIGLAIADGDMAQARERIDGLQAESGLPAGLSQRLQVIAQALGE